MRPARLGAIVVVTGLIGIIQAIIGSSAGAVTTTGCTSSAFSDNFTQDSVLGSCWQTETPLISAVEAQIGAIDTPPQLAFQGGGGMRMIGAAGVNQFNAIQSVAAFSAPFTFSVTAGGVAAGSDPFSYGSALGIYLVNSSLSSAFSVEGNFNPDAGSDYGIFANDGLTADGQGTEIVSSPQAEGDNYDVTISVDASGNVTASAFVANEEQPAGTQYPVGKIGTGPFYLLLGQDEGTPNAKVLADQSSFPQNQNWADWYSAELNNCPTTSLADDFSADSGLSSCWGTTGSAIGDVASGLGDDGNVVTPSLQFGYDFTPSFGNHMDMQGVGGDHSNQFTAVQSVNEYAAPFEFDASAATVQNNFNVPSSDTSWAIWLVNSANPSDTFSVQMNAGSASSNNGLFATDQLTTASTVSSNTTTISSSPPDGKYSVAMTVDAGGEASVLVSVLETGSSTPTSLGDFVVGNVGLGSYYAVLSQNSGSVTGPTGILNLETAWYYADLSPNYCSLGGGGSFFDNFTTDTALDQNCWSNSGSVLSNVATKVGLGLAPLNLPQGTFGNSINLLSFDNGMDMTSSAVGSTQFTGIQSTNSFDVPFDFETTVDGVQSGDNAFSVYLVDASGDTGMVGVEGNLSPGNGANYGLWDSQASIPAGQAAPGSEDLIADPSENTNYTISVSINAAGDASVEVNGVTSANHAYVGTGPFYVVLGQRDTNPSAAVPDQAAWYSADLTSQVQSTLSPSSPTVAGVETVPASVVPPSSVTGSSGAGASDAASAPLSSIPLASSPLSSIPLSSIPLSSIATPPSGDTAVTAAQNALSSVLLSDLSVTYPAGCGAAPAVACTGWTGILAGTPYASSPLEGVTLEDVLTNPTALANLNTVDLGALGLASSPLSSIPLSSIPLSSIPLSSIPLPGAGSGTAAALSSWCSQLQSIGFTCSSFGINDSSNAPNDNGVTLLTLALAGVPLSSIPLSSIPLSSIPLSSINLSSSPLSSIPLSSISLASNPLSSIPLSSIALGSSPLSSIPLSSIPLSSIPLSSIPLSSIPLSSIPLSYIPLSSIPLSSIPLSSIPLSSIPLSSIPLSSIPLSSIPLSSIPLSSIPLSSIPLSSIPLSSIPLSSIPLSSIPLSSIPLSSLTNLPQIVDCTTAEAQFPGLCETGTLGQAFTDVEILPNAELGLIPPGDYGSTTLGDLSKAAIDATTPVTTLGQLGTYGDTTLGELGTYNGTTLGQLGAYGTTTLGQLGTYNGTTLGQLGTYGATTLGQLGSYNGMTLAQLLADLNTSAPGFPRVTLGDLLLSMVAPASYPWQSVSLTNLPLAGNEIPGDGGTETYTAIFTVPSPSVQQVSATLPPSFAYVPGTTKLDGVAAPDPSQATSLTWELPMSEGSHVLTFEANAGIGLGSTAATVSVDAQATSTATSSVMVTDAEEPAIESPATAAPLTAGTPPFAEGNLNVGYLTTPGDLNDWSVQVSQGEELSLALTDLPATYDLELFGPSSAPLGGTVNQDLSGVTDTLPALAPGTTSESTPGSQDLQVTPPPGDSLEALSNNPDGQDQYIQTPPLAAGNYIVQVSGYNDVSSSQPYLLRANLLTGATSPSCPAINYPYSNLNPAPASGPTTVPTGTNTLFLLDTQRLTDAFGAGTASTPASPTSAGTLGTGEAGIMSLLQAVAADHAAGVTGAIVALDSYSAVQTAYQAWNSNPCSIAGANGVVTAISNVVDQIVAANPTVQNVVIVGADDQVPFARLADGAVESNERDYAASTFVGENNVEADALSLGYYFSDDPYGSPQPLGVGSATLYAPQLAVGRLIESGTQIESALQRFLSSNGDLDATASLTTGYSFLTSGAEAVSANLATDGLSAQTLISSSWTTANLDSALTAPATPGVDSLNAHFDYSRALPASDDTSGVDTNLFTTTDVRNNLSAFTGRLLFSMGCHSGLDIDDAEVDPSAGATAPIDDWAKTFADTGALWVANTGYGYADTDTIAYSAKLMSGFAANLNGPLTIGEALTEAKQQYAAGNAILSPYDLKALMESTLYGLPMYNLNKPAQPVAPPVGAAIGPVVNQTTGLTDLASPLAVSLTVGSGAGQLGLVTNGSNGEYYQVNGTASGAGTQATEFRPIEPLYSAQVAEPGLVPHGALLTALSSEDLADPAPAYSLPAAGSGASTPPNIGEAAFPGTLQRVASYGGFTHGGTAQGADLDLVAGQFLPSPSVPGAGTQRLFTSMSAQVYYVPSCPQNAISCNASPYAEDFTPPTIDSVGAPLSGNSLGFDVQVTPSAAPVQQVLVLYTDGANPGTWAVASLSSLDGQHWTGTGTLPASGQVQYIVEALDAAGNVAVSNNEGTAFATAYQTSTTVSTSPSSVAVNQPATLTASVNPASSAAGNPTGNVEFLDGATPIVSCGGATGAALTAARTASCMVSYAATGTHEITAQYLGNTNFTGSTSSAAALSVLRSATVSSFTVTGTPVTYGAETGLTFSATVTAGDGGLFPSGDTLTVSQGANTICTIGLAPAANSGSGTCSPSSNSVLSAGTFTNVLGTFNSGGGPTPTFVLVAPATLTLTVGGQVTPTISWPTPAAINYGTALTSAQLDATASVPGTFVYTPAVGTVLHAGANQLLTVSFTPSDSTDYTSASGSTTISVSQVRPTITWPTPAGINFGAKLTSAQLDATASVPGTFVYSPAAGTVLQPGTPTLTVAFTPTDTTDYTPASTTTTISVGFTQACITTAHSGSLTVANGQAICVSTGGKVTGSVSVAAGGSLYVSGGTITGSLSSSGALAIALCGAAITGSVSVSATSGPLMLGGPGCGGDTAASVSLNNNAGTTSFVNGKITGSLSASGNSGPVSISLSSIAGSMSASSNPGGVTISGNTVAGSAAVSSNSGCTFTNNTISGSLVITNNTGVFVYSGNTVHGSVSNSGNT